MKQVFYPYWLWEDWKAGMWRKVPSSEHNKWLLKAVDFTGNASLYGKWMIQVVESWPISCEHNLTDVNQNRQAWIGHAAVTLAIGCPEYIVREAWGLLAEQQRVEANKQADQAILKWENNYEKKDHGLYSQMEITGVL